MPQFIVIENEDGLLVDQIGPSETAEQVALAKGGVVVDPRPYASYDDAYDAMQQIPATVEELGESPDEP